MAACEPAARRAPAGRAALRRDPRSREAVPGAGRVAAVGLDAAPALVRPVRGLRTAAARRRGRLAVLDVPRARPGVVDLPRDATPYWLRGELAPARVRSDATLD